MGYKKVIVIGSGNQGVVAAELAASLCVTEKELIIVSPEQAKESSFIDNPSVIPYELSPSKFLELKPLVHEKKNYINGKWLPKKKRKK